MLFVEFLTEILRDLMCCHAFHPFLPFYFTVWHLFQPKFDVCLTLELDIKQTLGLGVNLIFIFNQNLIKVETEQVWGTN